MAKTRLKIVNLIRGILRSPRPDWEVVENLCAAARLNDTAFEDKLRNRDKAGLLQDYLLSPAHYKRLAK